jgi:hypothetical protein
MLPAIRSPLTRRVAGRLLLGALLSVAVLPTAAAPAATLASADPSVLQSHTELTLGRDGVIRIEHDIELETRGPFQEFMLEGAATDAGPTPNAQLTVLSAQGNRGASEPLVLERVEGGLRLKRPNTETEDGTKRKRRTKSDRSARSAAGGDRNRWLLHAAYTADARARGWLEPQASGQAQLEWPGPRFNNGVDGATVVVRVPHTARPSALQAHDSAPWGTVQAHAERRGAWDELELVRPHLAAQEQSVWRITGDAGARGFGGGGGGGGGVWGGGETPTPPPPPQNRSATRRSQRRRSSRRCPVHPECPVRPISDLAKS